MGSADRVHHSNGVHSYTLQTISKPKLISPKHSAVVWVVSPLGQKAICQVLVQHPAQLAPVLRDGSQGLLQCLQKFNLTVVYGKKVMKEKIKRSINYGLGKVFTMYVQ